MDSTVTPDERLDAIQRHFHALILQRATEFAVGKELTLPQLDMEVLRNGEPGWFQVPGMYGGFKYWWDAPTEALHTESWCRIVEGSEQIHVINFLGITLLRESYAPPAMYVAKKPFKPDHGGNE